jgi:hypothetical protein
LLYEQDDMATKRRNGSKDTHLAAAYLGERHEARYMVPIEIEVSGIKKNRALFREMTLTRDVSSWGCSFPLPMKLLSNDIVLVRLAKGNLPENQAVRRSLFQVLRVTRERNGWLIAAWKLEDHDLWGNLLKENDPARQSRNSRKSGLDNPRRRARKT